MNPVLPSPMPIADSSPLMGLYAVGLLPLLGRLYGRVYIPEAVRDELRRNRARGKKSPDPADYDWLELQPNRHSEHVGGFDLGAGETAVIAQAQAWQDRNVIALLDDGAARQAAEVLGVRHTGVIGLVLRWKELGWLPAVRPVLDGLSANNFHIGKELRALALKLAGETEDE